MEANYVILYLEESTPGSRSIRNDYENTVSPNRSRSSDYVLGTGQDKAGN